MTFFHIIIKKDLEIYREPHKNPQIAKAILNIRAKKETLDFPAVKTSCEATLRNTTGILIRTDTQSSGTACGLQKWNHEPAASWFLTVVLKAYFGGKGCLFNNLFLEIWIFICRRIKVDSYILPVTNINSKWLKKSKSKLWNYKIARKTHRGTLQDTGIISSFLAKIHKAEKQEKS